LSSAEQWSEVHEGFDYRAFYYFIIDFFEDVEGAEARKRSQQLLKWWNEYVFYLLANSASGG